MSLEKNYFVIIGYNIMDYITDKFSNWVDTEEFEKYAYNHNVNTIQLFNDPVGGCHLYFGKIIAMGDEYSFENSSFDINELYKAKDEVIEEVLNLNTKGIFKDIFNLLDKMQIITFMECY